MKKFLPVLILAVAAGTSAAAADPALTKFTWLAGDWQQSLGASRPDEIRIVEEHWSTPSANGLIGMSRTLRGERTVSFEFLRIEQRESGIFYVAQPNGRPPTDFKLASWTETELVFEGDGSDKVRRITYRRQGPTGLYASVEGE
jgi:hypothetical protein